MTKAKKHPYISKSNTGTPHIFYKLVTPLASGEGWRSVCGKLYAKSAWRAKQTEIDRVEVCGTCRTHFNLEKHGVF